MAFALKDIFFLLYRTLAAGKVSLSWQRAELSGQGEICVQGGQGSAPCLGAGPGCLLAQGAGASSGAAGESWVCACLLSSLGQGLCVTDRWPVGRRTESRGLKCIPACQAWGPKSPCCPCPGCSVPSSECLCKCYQLGKMQLAPHLGERQSWPAEGTAWWSRSGKGGGGSQGLGGREPLISLGPLVGAVPLAPQGSYHVSCAHPGPPSSSS